jgi:DnaJ homologue, subfamily C, member 28, conserved domain
MGGFESWIDRQIREAQERGVFDNLPGAGKPIRGLDGRRDDDWWAKDLIRREKLTMPLPTSLALRKEVEDLPETLAAERSEDVVRTLVDDLNRRILDARRRVVSGPPVVVRTVDVEQAVVAWRQSRARAEERRRAALAEHRSRRQARGD